MTLLYTPDKETQDALNARLAEFNTKENASLNLADFLLQQVVVPYGEQLKRQKFESAVSRISEAAKQLPYEQRLQLIDTIESQVK